MLSRNNIKYIQSLSHKKYRNIHRRFVAETPKVVNEFLKSSYKIDTIAANEEWLIKNRERIAASTKIIQADDEELGRISLLKTAHQVIAVIEMPATAIPEDVEMGWVLALDNIQDPGNMGTILRIADWFGISQIFCNTETVDVYNPKVVQSSMGSLAREKIYYLNLEEFLRGNGERVYLTTLRGESVYGLSGLKPGIVVIGNEGNGIGDAILSGGYRSLSIPGIGEAESLNAAVATGIILSHLVPTGTS